MFLSIRKKNIYKGIFITLFISVIVFILLFQILFNIHSAEYEYPFQDPSNDIEIRIDDLVSRLTTDEKVSLLHQYQPAINRLGIPAFRTGTEALHGVAWLGEATVFPQATGLGCTWDTELVKQIGSAVGDEARGFNKRNPARNGLSLWAPVVDLQRDPRAGRFEEGYSEDAYLTGQMAIAYSSGIKGDDPFYYKAIPTLKHFYAYNQEENRDRISVNIDERNMHEYYLKAFQLPIESGSVKSIMTSYNLVNNIPCTVSPDINNFIKGVWAKDKDFFVVTDANGPQNLVSSQRYYSDMASACAGMIKAGVDSMTQDSQNSTNTINNINTALSRHLITIEDIDKAVRNILEVRFHVGDFDPAGLNPYSNLNESEICASDHAVLANKAAKESIVLLKNNNILPLRKNISVAVIGTIANEVYTDFYSGTLPYKVTPLSGIRNKVSQVNYAVDNSNDQAVNAARNSDVAIVFVGNDPLCGDLGWAVPRYPSEGKEDVDRESINLEPFDDELIKSVYNANQNTILVLVSSFPYSINWENENLPAIVYTCHSGQEIGNAVSDVLFGDYNPGGKLNSTWYSSLNQIPSKTSYDIINGNRTYMYFQGTPLYCFGHGLSYTNFEYSNLTLSSNNISGSESVEVSFNIRNTGSIAGDEVSQLYLKDVEASIKRPVKELADFDRISLAPGETKNVKFIIEAEKLAFWDTGKKNFYVEPGSFSIMIGSSSNDIRLQGTFNVSNGGITPTNTNLGDVNNNGKVDIVDALEVSKYVVGNASSNFNAANADVNKDGQINMVDALLIARYYVGAISNFP